MEVDSGFGRIQRVWSYTEGLVDLERPVTSLVYTCGRNYRLLFFLINSKHPFGLLSHEKQLGCRFFVWAGRAELTALISRMPLI